MLKLIRVVCLDQRSPQLFLFNNPWTRFAKSQGKEYVVILDFIGNYNNNFMIPIALSG